MLTNSSLAMHQYASPFVKLRLNEMIGYWQDICVLVPYKRLEDVEYSR